jgi:hypothetical protein
MASNDVTEEYVDIEGQLRNLRLTEARITALMAKAERIEDILTLDRELRTIQGEIERLQGRINFLKESAALSTIDVALEITPPPPASPKPVEGWDAMAIAGRAWDSSVAMLQGVAGFIITVGISFWWLIVAALIGVAIWRATASKRARLSNA